MCELVIDKISKISGRIPSSCSCDACKSQCRRCSCLGTPDDIKQLIDAGYKDKLIVTLWVAGMLSGVVNFPIPMIQAIHNQGTGCVFFKDGLCTLHDAGLKPTEGRLSHHSMKIDNFDPKKHVSWLVAKEWLTLDALDFVEKFGT